MDSVLPVERAQVQPVCSDALDQDVYLDCDTLAPSSLLVSDTNDTTSIDAEPVSTVMFPSTEYNLCGKLKFMMLTCFLHISATVI